MVEYPLPTPNPDNIIQHGDKTERELQQDTALHHIASEAVLHGTFESYMAAIQANTLGSVPAPNEENLKILVAEKYGTIRKFYDAALEGDIGGIDTIRVQLNKVQKISGMQVTKPEDMLTYAKSMSDYDREHIKLFHLDSQNRIIGIETISIGTLNSTSAHPREVIKGAVLNNSAGVIIAHNHPSGALDASEADKKVAQGLINAFAIVDIRVLDFVIMANDQVKSFSDTGTMPSVSPFVREMGQDDSENDACNIAYQAAIEVMADKCKNE